MSGIDSEMDGSSLSRPILIKPFKENKLLHLEFETNPLNNNSDYRINCKSQSFQINYHSVFFIYLFFLLIKYLFIYLDDN